MHIQVDPVLNTFLDADMPDSGSDNWGRVSPSGTSGSDRWRRRTGSCGGVPDWWRVMERGGGDSCADDYNDDNNLGLRSPKFTLTKGGRLSASLPNFARLRMKIDLGAGDSTRFIGDLSGFSNGLTDFQDILYARIFNGGGLSFGKRRTIRRALWCYWQRAR